MLYNKMFTVDLSELPTLAEGYCCGEAKSVHRGCENSPTCVFCEDECAGCEAPLFE